MAETLALNGPHSTPKPVSLEVQGAQAAVAVSVEPDSTTKAPEVQHAAEVPVAVVGGSKREAERIIGQEKCAMPGGDQVPQPAPQRGGGRPKGSRKLPNQASAGEMPIINPVHFVPYIIHLAEGEDICEKLRHFGQNVPGMYLITSAVGPIRTAGICTPEFHRYEGCFEIVHLSGSRTFKSDAVGNVSQKVSLNIILEDVSQEKVFGGIVSGPIIAGGAIQITLISYNNPEKRKSKPRKVGDSNELLQPTNGIEEQIAVQTATSQTPVMGDQQIPDGTNQPGEPVPSSNGKKIDSEVVLMESIASLPFQHQCSELREGNDNGSGQKDKDVPAEFPVMQNASSRSEPI